MRVYHIKKFIKGEYSFSDIMNYFIGNFRYFLYYNKILQWLIRPHIHEQIHFRITVMDRDCYNDGQCKICGCRTTHLQMANKACEGNCYPDMKKAKVWKALKNYYWHYYWRNKNNEQIGLGKLFKDKKEWYRMKDGIR